MRIPPFCYRAVRFVDVSPAYGCPAAWNFAVRFSAHYFSVRDPDDPVGHLRDVVVVGDDDHRLLVLPAQHFKKADHIVAGSGVQVPGRLVRKDNRRPCRQRPDDRHALLLSAGQHGREHFLFCPRFVMF